MVNHANWKGISIRTLMVILILIVSYYVINFTLPLIYPFLIGWLISMMIEPLVSWLEKKGRIPRWISVTVILLIIFGLIFSLVFFIIAEIIVELTHLADLIPSFFDQAQKVFVDTFTTKNTSLQRLISTLQTYLEKNPDSQKQIIDGIRENAGVLARQGTAFVTGILSGIGQFLSDLPFLLTVLVFIILATFFISLDWPRLKKNLVSLIPKKAQATSGMVLQDLKKALFGFVRAQLILISITALIMLIGLLILQIPYAVTIAFLIGFVDLLPYLGVGAVLVPWIIYLFFTGNMKLGIGLAILYGVIVVVRQFLEPKLLSSNVGLDPLLTLISLFVGLNLFGFLGIIIGPVTVVIILALHRAKVFQDIWKFILEGNR